MLSIRGDFVIMSKETTGVEARLKITELFVELPFKLSPVVKLPHYTVSAFLPRFYNHVISIQFPLWNIISFIESNLSVR